MYITLFLGKPKIRMQRYLLQYTGSSKTIFVLLVVISGSSSPQNLRSKKHISTRGGASKMAMVSKTERESKDTPDRDE